MRTQPNFARILTRNNAQRVQTEFSAETGYLVRKNADKAVVTHVWTGKDTACFMASTGGLNLRKYEVVAQSDLPICGNCLRLLPADFKPEPALVWPEIVDPIGA